MPHPFVAHSWFWWGKGCWILTAKGVETAHGDCLSRAVSLSFISGLIFKRSAGAAERPQCTECCPCRAWHPPCWSSFPPSVLRKLPCRQRGTGDTRPSAALQGKPAGSFPAWRVTLLVAGLRVSEDVPPRPALSPRPPAGSAPRTVRAARRAAAGRRQLCPQPRSCAPSLPKRAGSSQSSPEQP